MQVGHEKRDHSSGVGDFGWTNPGFWSTSTFAKPETEQSNNRAPNQGLQFRGAWLERGERECAAAPMLLPESPTASRRKKPRGFTGAYSKAPWKVLRSVLSDFLWPHRQCLWNSFFFFASRFWTSQKNLSPKSLNFSNKAPEPFILFFLIGLFSVFF